MREDDGPEKKNEPGTQSLHAHSAAERFLNRHVGKAIHLFLSLLSVIIVAGAVLATYYAIVNEFPLLWRPHPGEYVALQGLVQMIFLIAIAAELGLLLLFHRPRAAVEVIILVIARKLVTPQISGLDLLLSVVALAIMFTIRFRYIRAEGG